MQLFVSVNISISDHFERYFETLKTVVQLVELTDDRMVGGSNPGLNCSYVKVSLGTDHTLLPMGLAVPCMALATHWCVNVWMNPTTPGLPQDQRINLRVYEN